MNKSYSDPVSAYCLPSNHTTRFTTAKLDISEVQEQEEKMIEVLPQQAFQPQYFTPNHQQSVHCRQSAGLFHAPASPSPLGLRHANAQSSIFPSMNMRETQEDNDNNCFKFGGFSGQENPFTSPLNNQSNNSKIFSFPPANNNTVTPPSKQSTYEARFRNSGGSNNPFSKIFGSPSPSSSNGSSSTSTSASKHRQLFLNKVKQNRDNARFNTRGETLAMMEYHSEQQSWDDRMRRKADTMYHQDYLLEDEVPGDDINNSNNAYINENGEMAIAAQSALEEFLMQEEQDMDAVLSEVQSPTSGSVRSHRSSFCGDDGDYDDIFMELVDNDQDATMSF